MSNPVTRWRIALSPSQMTDPQRLSMVAGIQHVAQQSALMQNTAIAASYASLGKKAAALQADTAAVAADEKQLKLDMNARKGSRVALDVETTTLKTLVAANATSASDIVGMGFTPLVELAKGQNAVPELPGPLVAIPGKKQGHARAAIAAPGKLPGSFAAEISTDPFGAATWQALPGSGKQRRLSGYASGTRLWVRFAAVRYGQQGPWCTPVLVTIP